MVVTEEDKIQGLSHDCGGKRADWIRREVVLIGLGPLVCGGSSES